MYLQTASAAQRIGITPDAVRHAVRDGRLRVADATDRGTQLYEEQEVERFRQEREARLRSRGESKALSAARAK